MSDLRPPIADPEEVLRLLTTAARNGHVGAARLLLAELRRNAEAEEADQDVVAEVEVATGATVVDQLAERRARETAD